MDNLEQTKQILEEKREQLQSQLADLDARDPSEDSFRTNDNAIEDEGDEKELGANVTAEREMVEKTLAKVVRALEKVEAGTYGICDMSGEQIDPERLKAIPWATYTLESERALEKRGRA